MIPEVSLREVIATLEILSDESVAYLNRETGDLCTVGEEEAGLAEDGVDLQNVPAWLIDELPRIREVIESEHWLPLPTRFDIHEWSIMDEFARSVKNPALGEELRGALHGRGAFRRFQEAVHRHGIEDLWHDHRDSALSRIAVDWLDEHGIAYRRD